MTETLKDELLLYLGELMYDYDNINDYSNKIEIGSKISLINKLLEQ